MIKINVIKIKWSKSYWSNSKWTSKWTILWKQSEQNHRDQHKQDQNWITKKCDNIQNDQIKDNIESVQVQ